MIADALGAGARGAIRNWRFTAGAALILGLGAGAAGVLVGVGRTLHGHSPHGVREASRLLRIYATPRNAFASAANGPVFSFAEFDALRARLEGRLSVAAYVPRRVVVGADGARMASAALVSRNFLPILGVTPAVGVEPLFHERSGVAPDILISAREATSRYGSAIAAVGERVQLQGSWFTIDGVLPEGFTGLDPEPVDYWLPMTDGELLGEPTEWREDGAARSLFLVARCEPALSDESCNHLRTRGQLAMTLDDSTSDASTDQIESPALVPPSQSRGGDAPIIVASVLIATIVVVNVLALAAIRGHRRHAEWAIRRIVGASRRARGCQLAAESLVVGLGTVLVGLFVVFCAGGLLHQISWMQNFTVDFPVLFATALASLAGAIAVGGAFAAAAQRVKNHDAAIAAARDFAILRRVTIALQTGLTVLALSVASRSVRSFVRAHQVELGFVADGLYALTPANPSALGARDPRWSQILSAIREIPGTSASLSATIPLESSLEMMIGAPETSAEHSAIVARADVGYFATLGTALAQGRDFIPSEIASGAAVAIVNERIAKELFPGRWPIGACLTIGGSHDAHCARIIGVVRDAKYVGIDEPTRLFVAIPRTAAGATVGTSLLLRVVRGDAGRALAQAAATMRRASIAELPIEIRSVAATVRSRAIIWRTWTALFVTLGLLALLISASGTYACVRYVLELRSRELAVRLALGCSGRNVARVACWDVSLASVAGCAIATGMTAAAFASREAGLSLLWADWASVWIAVLLVITTTLVALALPVRAMLRQPIGDQLKSGTW